MFRILILDHRKLAFMVLALALCVKALVPAGFMIERKAMVLTVSICADGLGSQSTRHIVVPMKPDADSHGNEQGKGDKNCAFSSLGSGALVSIDSQLLVVALLFILALGFNGEVVRHFFAPGRLMPPAQGPPLFG